MAGGSAMSSLTLATTWSSLLARSSKLWPAKGRSRLRRAPEACSLRLSTALAKVDSAVVIWLIVLGLYVWTLWRGFKRSQGDWRSRGVLLGCIGALIGFFASGLVHYNLGDQEVAMTFFLLMALGVRLSEPDSAEDILLPSSPILEPSA